MECEHGRCGCGERLGLTRPPSRQARLGYLDGVVTVDVHDGGLLSTVRTLERHGIAPVAGQCLDPDQRGHN
jgi:hypothetical protein